jgi:hypothetical protein
VRGNRTHSAFDQRQVELAQAVAVRKDINLDDLAADRKPTTEKG